jgi:membrane-bound lytic murein transglycosylase B
MKISNLKSPPIFFSFMLALSLFSTYSAADSYSNKKDVKIFIQEMEKKHHFDKKYLQKLFAEAKIYDSILEAIARPAESKPWHQYRPIFVTPERTQGGIDFWKKNASALVRAEEKYGVPQEIIVAIIGVETRYGQHAGRYPVFDALATLAFAYPPRATFFRGELEQFLLMAREEKFAAKELLGSYAGAMGLPQFIASSFRQYAVDFDGDGKRDLWSNPTDAIGSVANYFRKHHWQTGQPITQKVQVYGSQLNRLLTPNLQPSHTLDELRNNGVLLPNTTEKNGKGKLLKFMNSDNAEYWVGWNNFYVITRYNHSALYSMAIYQLSQKIKQGYLNL